MLFNNLDSRLRTRGINDTLKFVKDIRLVFMGYLSGNPIKLANVPSTKLGVPRVFGVT